MNKMCLAAIVISMAGYRLEAAHKQGVEHATVGMSNYCPRLAFGPLNPSFVLHKNGGYIYPTEEKRQNPPLWPYVLIHRPTRAVKHTAQ